MKVESLEAKVVGVIDYGCGNLQSIANALAKLGVSYEVVSSPQDLSQYQKIILPGVGSFDHAISSLEESAFTDAIKTWALFPEHKILGICLGMQLLCNSSHESQENRKGLGLIDAEVKCLSECAKDKDLKVPHMGWNEISVLDAENKLLSKIQDKSDFYFVHSFGVFCQNESDVVAITEHGSKFTSIFYNGGNVYGVQFHPEKSQKAGLNLLRNFVFNA